MMIRQNPYRNHTPPGWNDMSTAPRDGTWIEVQNNWGVAPWFGRYRWTNERSGHNQYGGIESYTSSEYGWDDGKGGGVSDGSHLSWRPCEQAAEYVLPNGGEQDTRAYWLRAAGFNPAAYGAIDGETFEEESRREKHDPAAKRDRSPNPPAGAMKPEAAASLFSLALFLPAIVGLFIAVVL